MTIYDQAARASARVVTQYFSSSFGLASRLFSRTVRPDIYAIYGLVRIADEIVDTYTGADAGQLLSDLHHETHAAISRGYSPNPIVHAFALTARTHRIDPDHIDAFFASMALDTTPQIYSRALYERYIYGSAEVVGLMCVRVLCDDADYAALAPGARRLGAAYQKINFLRDLREDLDVLKRNYFNNTQFDAAEKSQIIAEIAADLQAAAPYIKRLPSSGRRAVFLSYLLFSALFQRLQTTPAPIIRQQRIRLGVLRKLLIAARSVAS